MRQLDFPLLTTAQGTKNFLFMIMQVFLRVYWNWTVYVSKEFTYDGNGDLISVNVL